MTPEQLASHLDTLLQFRLYKDHIRNGLLVDGGQEVKKVLTGVSFGDQLLDQAIQEGANCILVHHAHGFWDNQPRHLVGAHGQRVRKLIQNNISLVGCHLPLDGHPELGNNALLLKTVGAEMVTIVKDIIFVGTYPEGFYTGTNYLLSDLFNKGLGKPLAFFSYGPKEIHKVAVCSGGAPDYIEDAAAAGAQLYITGEAREHTQQRAKDLGIHFMAYGHHNTETFGVKALAEYIHKIYKIPAEFFNVPNPV